VGACDEDVCVVLRFHATVWTVRCCVNIPFADTVIQSIVADSESD
jgi:hypothetical protein